LVEENGQAVAETLALQKFIIERDIPKVALSSGNSCGKRRQN